MRNPLEDLSCILENKDIMCEDKEGVYHCLLVTGEGKRDGVLVESKGYDYARYASYVSDAAAQASFPATVSVVPSSSTMVWGRAVLAGRPYDPDWNGWNERWKLDLLSGSDTGRV